MKELNLIVAHDLKFGIGKDNKLPWHISRDLKRFKEITKGHAIIMGRKTFESIGKPLPERHNVVISRSMPKDEYEGVTVVKSPQEALEAAYKVDDSPFVIGGSTIYGSLMPFVTTLYITTVFGDYNCDAYFYPPKDLRLRSADGFFIGRPSYNFRVYDRGCRK